MTIAYASVPSLGHDMRDHPENAARVPAIIEALRDAGLLDSIAELDVSPAGLSEIESCHSAEYLDYLQRAAGRGGGYIDPAPTYVTASSFDDALMSAGAAIAVTDAVLDGRAAAALSLSRPPGHHAVPEAAMGFCLLNNIAIAARHAQSRGAESVLIVDFDVHHGNGTQDIFYADGSVFYFSTHQEGIYPGTGALDETGSGQGRGATLNVPLMAGAGDTALLRAMTELLAPAARRFAPDLLLVSAGFDAHYLDPLANLQCSGEGYHALTTVLADIAREHCDGRIAFFLEGGYNLQALGNAVVNVVRALGGQAPDSSLGTASGSEPDVSRVIDAARRLHAL
jgi:acetoin utilization deacetylase AcuC-like enzyme